MSNGVATGNKMFEPAVTSVFANVNLPLFVYFSSSSKYFFLSFEVNFTIFTAIVSEKERAITAFKKCLKSIFNDHDIATL